MAPFLSPDFPRIIRFRIDRQDVLIIDRGVVTYAIDLPQDYTSQSLDIYFDTNLVYSLSAQQGVLIDIYGMKQLLNTDIKSNSLI